MASPSRYALVILLLVTLICTTACARRGPQDRLSRTTGDLASPSLLVLQYATLSVLPNIQSELDLTEDQKVKINEATARMRTSIREMQLDIRNLSHEERQAKLEEINMKTQTVAQETKKTFEDILRPEQLKRLKGIALQMAGVSALSDKDVQQNLKLSGDQVAKIKVANDDLATKMGELFSKSADPQTRPSKMQMLRTDYENQVIGVLTADQKALLEKMKGAKFEISPTELGHPGAPSKRAQE